MKPPTPYFRTLISAVRRSNAGRGIIDVAVPGVLYGKVEEDVKIIATASGVVSQRIITIYFLIPCDITVGDVLTIPNKEDVEVRETETKLLPNGQPFYVKAVAW